MLTLSETRQHLAVLVPVYFDPQVERETVRTILERTFSEHETFCFRENLLAVVDGESTALEVMSGAGRESVLYGINLLVLPENRGKTGAIRLGLSRLLEQSPVDFLVTRDCDGDHLLEDLPRLVSAARHTGEKVGTGVSVFGVRPSLAKPMNWIREQWELLTNGIFLDVVQLLLAQNSRVLDRRFWNGYPLDLQSGYRLYDRWTAQVAVDSLNRLPDERDVYLMACEMLPFVEISLEGGTIAQVQRGTQVEQPVSSYARIPFSRCYGRLLAFLADSYRIPRRTLLEIFDNHLVSMPAFFSDHREDLLECRRSVHPDGGPVLLPAYL